MLLRSSLFLRPSTLYIPIKRTLFSPEYLGMPKFLEARNNYRYSLSDEEKTLQKPKSIILSNDVRHTFYMAMWELYLLIHSAYPQSVRPSPLFKTKQISSENNVCYWRDCGSGRVDHSLMTHLSCIYLFIVSEKQCMTSSWKLKCCGPLWFPSHLLQFWILMTYYFFKIWKFM